MKSNDLLQNLLRKDVNKKVQIAGQSSQVGLDVQPLFVFKRWSGRCWFNTKLKSTKDNQAQYRFAGWLLGQSFANRASLGVPFPHVLFSKLLEGQEFQVQAWHSLWDLLQAYDGTKRYSDNLKWCLRLLLCFGNVLKCEYQLWHLQATHASQNFLFKDLWKLGLIDSPVRVDCACKVFGITCSSLTRWNL